jgi:hypothetical protein
VFHSTPVARTIAGNRTFTGLQCSIPPALGLRPRTLAEDALEVAWSWLRKMKVHRYLAKPSVTRQLVFDPLVEKPTTIEIRHGLQSPARLHLEVFPRSRDAAELAWVVDLSLKNRRAFQLVVSASRPRPSVLYAGEGGTCCLTWLAAPPVAEQIQVPLPAAHWPQRLPSQWGAQNGKAQGPNVSCHHTGGSKVDALGALETENTFVWCNILHDFFAGLGFNAAHLALEGADAVKVDWLSDKDADGAFFRSKQHGSRPSMVLFASTTHGPHAACDPSIVIHEYVHGVNERLVGGGSEPVPFVGEEMCGYAEGTCDYFALTLLNQLDRSRTGPGTRSLIGEQFRPGGIRNYSTLDGNYADADGRYEIGMVWCSALLAARAAIALRVSADLADRFIWQTLVDSWMLMTPTVTSFGKAALRPSDARDALMLAAQSLQSQMGVAGGAGDLDSSLTARGI